MALGLVLILAGCSGSDPLLSNEDWTFINYWAEWCKPCIREVPELNALDARDGYRVLGVNFDGESGAELAAQEDKLRIAFPTLEIDPAPRFDLERPAVLPTTLVVAPGGRLHRVLVGPQTIDSLIAATEAGPGA
jgi:thiol-disulfide isomerase/thioredoxin